jgi:hypothetical protein
MIIRKQKVDKFHKGYIDYFEKDPEFIHNKGDWYYNLMTSDLYHSHLYPSRDPYVDQSTLICPTCGEKLPEHIFKHMLLRALE